MKWLGITMLIVNAAVLLLGIVFATAIAMVSKYDFALELSIAADWYLGPIELFLNAILLIALSLYFLTLFKNHSVILQLAIFVSAGATLAMYMFGTSLFYDSLKQNFLFYLIICIMLYICGIAMLVALYFAQSLETTRDIVCSVSFLIVSVTTLIVMFSFPLTSFPLTSVLSKEESEPLIIESGGNCHIAPPSTSLAILAMENMRFAEMAVIGVRITADDILVGASSRWKNVEQKTFSDLREIIIGNIWLKNDPYRIYHHMEYQTEYFSFDYSEMYQRIEKYLTVESFNSLKELLLVGMRLYIPFVLNIQAYEDEATQEHVARELIEVLEDLGLAEPDKVSFYSIRTGSFIIYSYISSRYNFIPFVLPPQATTESWCSQISYDICETQTRFTYHSLMDAYKTEELRNNAIVSGGLYDLTAVNSLTTYCLAKKMNFMRIHTNLNNDDVILDCTIENYLILWIVSMSLFYIAIISLLVLKFIYHKEEKGEIYG